MNSSLPRDRDDVSPVIAPAPCPYRLQVAASVTRYQSCTVDPRPGRAVHCPDLNACLVNEGRPVAVDCRAVHFGYAIPVTVVPLPEEPELAELVLDPSPDLTPEAVSYLLRHHPQLRSENLRETINGGTVTLVNNNNNNEDDMAATAKHEHLRGRGKFTPEPEEDIAAIAKQISDHAEAIYQTWKSRGLAPTEILTCHSNATAADKFGSALTPVPNQQQQMASPAQQTTASPSKSIQRTAGKKTPSSPVADLLASAPSLDANNLEQLVNNFVVEDKARLAAARQQQKSQQPSKALPSSIQFALQKFEKQSPPKSSSPPNSFIKPAPIIISEASVVPKTQPSVSKTQSPGVGQFSPHHARTSSIPSTTPVKSPQPFHQQGVHLDTIETTFPPELNLNKQPKKTVDTPDPNSSSGLTTWPLKNKNITGNVTDRRTVKSSPGLEIGERKPSTDDPSAKYATLPANKSGSNNNNNNNNKNTAYMDEVAREEERLINALKTGIIIAEEPTGTKSSSGGSGGNIDKKKSNILLKKNNKDKLANVEKKKKPIQQQQQQHSPDVFVPATGSPMLGSDVVGSVSPKTCVQPLAVSIVTSAPTVSTLSSAITSKSSALESPKGQVKEDLDKSSLSNMSLVDYAKVRYRAAQEHPLTQQRLEDVKQLRVSSGSPTGDKHGQQEVISVARNRFQVGPRGVSTSPVETWKGEWTPGRFEDCEEGARRAVGGRGRPETVPHPELTSQQRQHIRAAAAAAAANGAVGSSNNPVRPFLTRGSVAERVLIFEKCPSELLLDKRAGRAPAINTWRTGHEVQARAQTYSRPKESPRPVTTLPPNTTLQRHVKANRNVHIPRFYYPKGKPSNDQQLDTALQKIAAAFQQFPNQQVSRDQFSTITKACDCPLYWKVPLFIAAGGEKLGYVEAKSFLEFWKELLSTCHDQAAHFLYILSKGQMRDLTTDDFIPFVQDVVDTHPGLTFLKEATEFHSRYVHTVITRIFYCVNRSWSGRISLAELRRSDLLRILQLLEDEEDINQVTAYFSYEHFYVIYCKFWELDRDHDLFIDRQDLARHSDHALSSRMIDRIFSGAVTRGGRQHEDKMSYTEFVWFLLSEEDKSHPTAIEYWFRCMDLDGDGYLSMYELEYFYEEQLQRMEAIGIETLPFEDCLCQMLDMLHPTEPGKVSLSDLKRCKMTPIFFDTFFNLEKYLDHEQRDPFASQRDHDTDGQELSDWDRYAAEEYELLVAEEGGNDHQDEFPFEDDVEDDILSPNLDNIVTNSITENSSVSVPEKGSEQCGNQQWKKPSFKVTDFDQDDGDYAADSDECSV